MNLLPPIMASPFRRKTKEREARADSDDLELEEVVESEEPLEENVAEVLESLDLELALFELSLIHISEPTRQEAISYAVFCLKKKKK